MTDNDLGLDFEAIIAEAQSRPRALSKAAQKAEKERCKEDMIYFIEKYVHILDSVTASWISFVLWSSQKDFLQIVHANKFTIVIKSRQMGITWDILSYIAWRMEFYNDFQAVVFSQREDDAHEMISANRLRGIHDRLPSWLRSDIKIDSVKQFQLKNGSRVVALPETAGADSRSVNLVAIDEADLTLDLEKLIKRSRPSIEAGENKMVVFSRSNKDVPNSHFKKLYRTAMNGQNEYVHYFIPWFAHPLRTQAWYEATRAAELATTGSLDGVYEMYPETEDQALMGKASNKRLPFEFLALCKVLLTPRRDIKNAPPIPELTIYVEPEAGEDYAVGQDPAEGNAASDNSVSQVINARTGEQCAILKGKLDPETHTRYTALTSAYYNNAPVLFELNNHGHLVAACYRNEYSHVVLRHGMNSADPGWTTSRPSKEYLYDQAHNFIRDEKPPIHDAETFSELASIETVVPKKSGDGSKYLTAPEGQFDDCAMAYVLAIECAMSGTVSMETLKHDLYRRQPALSLSDAPAKARKLPQISNQDTLVEDLMMQIRYKATREDLE